MTEFKKNQKVWVECIVKTLDPEDNRYDMAVRFGDREHDFTWLSSTRSKILTESPQQPKPPAPVRLYGHTIFDLQNCVHIGDVKFHDFADEKKHAVNIFVIRGTEEQLVQFLFDTQEEATAAREVIEKKVLEAKGVDDVN